MMTSTRELFDRMRKGDDSAFESIYKRYAPRLYYFVYEYIPQDDIAENIVQETFLTLWRKRLNLDEDTNLGAYLYTVSKNNCLYKIRDQKYRRHFISASHISEIELMANYRALASFDTSTLTMDEISRIIQSTLEQLPPQCRHVFSLSRFSEKKNREIASELNISEKAVEGHITKALKMFRESLKDYLPIMSYIFF